MTFTTTVASSSGTPTGSVSFKDGGTVIGTAALAGGSAALTISTLTLGNHSITAVYAGGGTFAGSTSAVLTQAVAVPADGAKLRAPCRSHVTKIEAQGSAAAITGAVDDAIEEGFSNQAQSVPRRTAAACTSTSRPSPFQRIRRRRASATPSRPSATRATIIYKAPPPPPPPARQWLAWADARGTGWNTSLSAGDIEGGQEVNAVAGLTRKITPDVLVGVFGGYESFNYTSQLLAGTLKGDGWTVGGYAAWRLLPGLRFDITGARSGVDYDGVAGTAAGSFPGSRWIASTGLTRDLKTYGFDIEPSARVYGLWEHEDAFYVDSLGTPQASRDFSSGRASAGTKVTYTLDVLVDHDGCALCGHLRRLFLHQGQRHRDPAADRVHRRLSRRASPRAYRSGVRGRRQAFGRRRGRRTSARAISPSGRSAAAPACRSEIGATDRSEIGAQTGDRSAGRVCSRSTAGDPERPPTGRDRSLAAVSSQPT